MKQRTLYTILAACGLGFLLYRKVSNVSSMIENLTVKPLLKGSPTVKATGGNAAAKFFNTITGGTYLEIPLNIEFNNRSGEELLVTINSIMAYIDNNLLATSKPAAPTISIRPAATSTLENVKMQVDVKQLLSVFGSTLENWLTNKNFSNITDNLKIKVNAVVNNLFSFNLMLKIGQSGGVDTTATISGLGLAAASKRKISPLSDYISYIPDRSNLKYNDLIVKADGSVVDTAHIMHAAATADKENVRRLAEHLQKDTLEATLKSIWDFVYTHIQYELDSVFTEQVRRPLRTLYDQKGDCDCYATLIGSMLEALGIPYKFRIAAYKAGRFQHVYVIVPNGVGHYTVDPVLDVCFGEKPPTKFMDI